MNSSNVIKGQPDAPESTPNPRGAEVRQGVEKSIVEKLGKAGLAKGYHYDFAFHPERCLWTAHFDVAQKIAKAIGRKWDGYNIDMVGGYYYWNLGE
jgi:hypothetical protein